MESLAIDNKIVTAVIPFFNPENIFSKVIQDTLPFVDELVLVNDGSTISFDDDSLFSNSKIHRINFETNKGKGTALRIGIAKALSLGSKYIIMLDSDYQHEPKYIPLFLQELKSSQFVIGKRNISFKDMPYMRVLSNTITSKILSIKTKQNILDSQSGFRGFDASILPDILPDSSGFEAESEMILRAAKKGIQISFIDISTRYANQKSSIKAFDVIPKFITVILKY